MSNAHHTWPRLYIKESLKADQAIPFDQAQSHYLCQVMRLRVGDSLRLFNGRDGEWQAALTRESKGKKNDAIVTVIKQIREQRTEPDLWLCAAPIKRSHFEYAISKATELGVSLIQPVLTSRTQIRDLNVERLRSLIIEAAEQSERLTLPDIKEPISLDDLCQNWPKERLAILCAEHGQAQPLASALLSKCNEQRGAAIFTGPEGGYTKEELDVISALPHHLSVRLGPRILRADTAVLAALSCYQAMCGDWKDHETTTNNR